MQVKHVVDDSYDIYHILAFWKTTVSHLPTDAMAVAYIYF